MINKELFIEFKPKNNKLYSLDTLGKIIYIRHGRSIYNDDCEKLGEMNIITNSKYINADLCEKGIEQAQSKQNIYNKLDILVGYVSPLNRAIQTAYNIFENHPQRNNFTFIIHPFLTEIVISITDLIDDIEKTKKKYNLNSKVKFDWSLFDEYYKTEKERNLFFFNFVDAFDDETKKYFVNKISESYKKPEFLNNLSEMIQKEMELKLWGIETLNHCFYRGLNFKKFIKDKYKNDLNNNEKKIIVVTHSDYVRLASSKKAFDNETIKNFPDDGILLKNCECLSIYI